MNERIKTGLAVLFPVLIVTPFITAGICGPDPGPDPCASDPFGCQEPGGFEYDDTCDLTGVLEVEVGHGESRFISFETTPVPEAHFGSQGGQHMFVALRVSGADLSRYSKLRAEFRLTQPIDGCVADASSSGEVGEGDASGPPEPDACTYLRAQRVVVLGESGTLVENPDGFIEEHGIILFDVGGADPNTLTVTVEDPCRRSGEDSAVFAR